jgi:hypothetical protein
MKPKSSIDNLISTVGGIVVLLTSVYLYQSGYQNNWIIAMGILGIIKLV